MTRVLLIRHATYPGLGEVFVGRAPAVHLDAHGRAQAAQLAQRLAGEPLSAIYASPLDRTLETAEPLARRFVLPVRIAPNLIDVDAGGWTGRRFADLDGDTEWHAYNRHRSRTAPPGGESLRAITRRVVRELGTLARRHAGQTIAAVTHADVIRAALLYGTGRPLDEVNAIEVPPASITRLELIAGTVSRNDRNIPCSFRVEEEELLCPRHIR